MRAVILVHAAAGGMGQLLTRLVTHLGGRVFATASTPEKRAIAKTAGAVRAVPYADAVYDGVGKDTFDTSLAALRPRGTLVLFGAASGKVAPFDPLRLMAGPYLLTRPTLAHGRVHSPGKPTKHRQAPHHTVARTDGSSTDGARVTSPERLKDKRSTGPRRCVSLLG
jgi:NADPH:quinone reductase-like Zn-dependent oxidoreductase